MRIAFAAATALTLLAALLPAPLRPTPASEGPQLTGASLAAELGCGACHAGVPGPERVRGRAPALGADSPPLDPEFVFTYLADPVRRRADIGPTRMPDFRLDEAERLALALHLGTGRLTAGVARAAERHPEADAARGRLIYGTLGCAACHGEGRESRRVGPDLSRQGARVREEWLRGFLADPAPIRGPAHPEAPGARMPDFRLSGPEVDALTSYLRGLGASEGPPPGPLTAFQARRTEHWVEARLACLGCHRRDGVGGEIGPPLDGVAERLRAAFVGEIVRDPVRATGARSMPPQRMPAPEAERVARWLLDDPGPWRPAERRSLADPAHPAWRVGDADATEGAALYTRHCAACHGVEGRGDGWNAPALPVPPTAHSDAGLMGRRPDDTLFDGIHAGAFVLDGSPRMPPFGELLTEEQIAALVAHIRTLCRCAEPTWAGDGREPGGR